MKTYQEYEATKQECLIQSYRLALTTLAELEALPVDERDDEWETYHTTCFQDTRRLALELPLFEVMKIDKDMQS